MEKKKYLKKVTAPSKNDHFKAIPLVLRIPIIFLATIGDIVILINRGTLHVLKKAFSNSTRLLHELVLFTNNVSQYVQRKTKKISTSETIPIINAGTIFTRSASPRIQERLKIQAIQLYLAIVLRTTLSLRKLNPAIHLIRIFLKEVLLRFVFYISSAFAFLKKLYAFLTKPRIIPQTSRDALGRKLRGGLGKIKPALPRFRLRLPIPHLPPLFSGVLLGSFLVFFFVFLPYSVYSYVKLLPHPTLLSQRDIPVTTQIYDRNGELLYEIHGDEDRTPKKLEDIPEIVKQATIAIEDKEFYKHFGFSITGIARAARETFVEGNTQGGSTITQQLIRTALLTRDVTLSRKLREIILAFWAERIYSKDEILEMYFNQVPYGGTAWGIEAAAQMYFGKNISDVSLAEAAYLAGLPAAPSLYSPYGTHPEYAILRQKEVLNRMFDEGFITKEQFDEAGATKIAIRPNLVNIQAPHFVMYVKQLLAEKFGPRVVDKGGLRVLTTLDLTLQNKVQHIVTTNIDELASLSVGNGAAMVTNPKNGDILAMVGSKNYFDTTSDGNVNVTLAPRQPGSSIKPLMYALGLDKGILTAASLIEDSPVAFTIPGQPVYAPVNYDNRFHGIVTLRSALANSYNIPAVKSLNRLGVKNFIEKGQEFGITTWTDQSRFGLALTLGGGETRLIDMMGAYGTFANSGKRVEIDPILKVTDYTGAVLYEKDAAGGSAVISEGTAFIISDILADNAARAPAFGPNSKLVIPGKTVAVKTGTTNDKRDNLTFGYTPSYVVGVWVGNNNNAPMNPILTSGITGAAPIWNQIMTELLKNKSNEPFVKPASVVTVPCFGRSEYFTQGTEPKRGCGRLPSPGPSASPRAV